MRNKIQTMVTRLTFVIALLLFSPISAWAQMVVKGIVKDDLGEPITGATARVKGTNNGSMTDIDGKFSLKDVANGAIIEFSYVGYLSQEQPAKSSMEITLQEDRKMLDDVVVVGYGVQKKSVVTAAITKVGSEDLANTSPLRMDNALKGLAAGVNVTSSSGQPGEAARVRVRGTGTINNSDPLYIVDGMPIGGGLDFVNPNDIESIEVLKDAASGAIYGARAANGVILITTKKGKQGRTNVNYNASWGWQSAWKHRDVTNATEYAILQNERAIMGGKDPIYADPYNLKDLMGNSIPVNGGTDWQELVFNDNAPVVNHDFSISGATEKTNYYLSLGYYNQEGIIGGNYGHSNYDRLTLRSNNTYHLLDATKDRNFLNKVDVSVNLSYMRTHSTGISTNSEYGSILGSALYMSPILTPTVSGTVADEMVKTYEYNEKTNEKMYDLSRDKNGNPYTIAGFGGTYQEMNNPIAMMDAQVPTKNWSHKFVPSLNVDIQLWDNLKYRFSYNADMGFWGNDGVVNNLYYFSGNSKQEHTSASSFKAQNCTWQLENVISYDKEIGKHSFSIVLGQSALKTTGNQLGGDRWNLVNTDKPSIDYATGNYVNTFAPYYDENHNPVVLPEVWIYNQGENKYEKVENAAMTYHTGTTVQHGVYGGPYIVHTMSSLFARANYNYDERYMAEATVRRDGSSRFGKNNKYGIFPSFSLGWNFSKEEFLDLPEWFNAGKLRYSWGKNGNDNIGDFGYTSLTAMGNNVLFGKSATKHNGSKADKTANPDLKWEESEQHDLGIDLALFDNTLTFTADYFIKKTNGMIIEMPIPSYVGETKPIGNVGDMENKGVEFELGYRGRIGDLSYGIKGNITYLKNTLKNLGNSTGYLDCDGIQGISGGGTRAENGQPFPFFFGYKTAGVWQNMEEIHAAVANGEGVHYDDKGNILTEPGDLHIVDVNKDGVIDANDRTNIGNGNPDWTFGANLNLEWKGFDFNMFLQGVQGADVFDATYRTDVYSGNYPTWMLSRWTGEGTSNKYPKLANFDRNWLVSDIYVCDGSYLRIKNLSLGYTLPKQITKKAFIERLRVYGMVENLVTWTKYWGFDPEIASGGKSLGIDRGVYPQARTWTVGLNLSF